MGRGDRRLSSSRKRPNGRKRREYSVIEDSPPSLSVRRLALGKLVCTGAAVAALGPAHALTLGEISVSSSLGQPLSAKVPVELGAGELLVAGCVTSSPPSASDLGSVPNALVSVPEGAVPGRYDLRLSTSRPLYEPMYELRLELRCPGSARMVRQYVLMLDLPGARPVAATAPAAASDTPATVDRSRASTEAAPFAAPAASPPPARRPSPTPKPAPLPAGTTYRVQPGDTLSAIAARIANRGGLSIWQIADAIYSRNPEAFIRANPDLIRSGAEIVLPAPLAAHVPQAPAAEGMVATSPESDGARDPAQVAPERPLDSVPVTLPTPAQLSSAAQPSLPAVVREDVPEAAPVFQDEQVAEGAAGRESVATPAPAMVADESRRGDGVPAWLAAVVGVLLGAAASLLLLRERLAEALRGSRSTSADRMTDSAPEVTVAGVQARPTLGKPVEPSMVVVEEPRREPEHATQADPAPTDRQPAADTGLTHDLDEADLSADLSSLFGEEPDLALSDERQSAVEEANLDLDLSAAPVDVEIDHEIGWIDDLDETALTPTDQAGPLRGSDGDTVEHTDLHTMSQKALDDQQISNTLKEALDLLENDYEQELTASQVIDRARLGEILDDGDEEDTLVRTGTDQIPRR